MPMEGINEYIDISILKDLTFDFCRGELNKQNTSFRKEKTIETHLLEEYTEKYNEFLNEKINCFNMIIAF